MDIQFTTVSSDEDLKQIIQLQQKNLVTSISKEEKEKEGFVTVEHDFDILKRMQNEQPHIIAKDKDKVIGYTLCMTPRFCNDIPVLIPMFKQIEDSVYHAKKFIVMGQVCIDKSYRGQGVFRGLYQKMKCELQNSYDILITVVAADNLRSLNAHYAVGFKKLVVHQSDQIEWHLIHWKWA